MDNKRFIASIMEIVIGIVLMGISVYGTVDEYWSSFGIAMMTVGILQLFRQIRYKTNDEYREKFDIERTDERNRFIANKAWAWAGYLFVIVGAIGTIVLKLMGREDLMMMASYSVCLIMIFYWISYTILKRKY